MNAAVHSQSRSTPAQSGSTGVSWQDLPQPQRQKTSPPGRAPNQPALPRANGVARSNYPTRAASGPTVITRPATAGPATAGPATAGPAKTAPATASAAPAHLQTAKAAADKPEHAILFQKYFKSVGTRTYVAQLKVATNGNHYLVLTEASRIKGTDDIRKTRVFIYSEDFKAFFQLIAESQGYIATNPVPADIAQERATFWRKVNSRRGRKSAN